MEKIPVSILGATGTVGQRFVLHLAQHPQFEIAHLAASEKNEGKKYSESCDWRLSGLPYAGLGSRKMVLCKPEDAAAPIVFSALDAEAARTIESDFARSGSFVFSNASAWRMEDDIPLMFPEFNPDHLGLITTQRTKHSWKGGIITNPNCTTIVLVGALGPLHRKFGVESALVVSMQALSGAGYPGVASLDSTANVIPYIQNEEQKVESESKKILGVFNGSKIDYETFTISAHCNRVPVVEGHTLSVSVRLTGNPNVEEVKKTLTEYVPLTKPYTLPTAPMRFLHLHENKNRPQPRMDAEEDKGMAIHIGRIRHCPILGIKMTVLGHNTERGAAGASILNAEMAVAMGIL